MLYNVIGYNNEMIGQVEAEDAKAAWEKATAQFNEVLDVRPLTEIEEYLDRVLFHQLDYESEKMLRVGKTRLQAERELEDYARSFITSDPIARSNINVAESYAFGMVDDLLNSKWG